MGRKVFVTYKYSDNQVMDLDIYEQTWWGNSKIQTTARHYVDKLSEILENELGAEQYNKTNDLKQFLDLAKNYRWKSSDF